MTETCTWCGERIEPKEERVEVIRRSPGGLAERNTLAVFHANLPCADEAADYGWS